MFIRAAGQTAARFPDAPRAERPIDPTPKTKRDRTIAAQHLRHETCGTSAKTGA